jgi:hypothetical protein
MVEFVNNDRLLDNAPTPRNESAHNNVRIGLMHLPEKLTNKLMVLRTNAFNAAP